MAARPGTPATTATIAAGTTSVLVRTPITNDALDEAAETFTLTATRTTGTTTNTASTGTATITDDDATPTLSINDVTVNEAAGTATFTVTLNAASGQTVTANYATSSGTATSGADFAAASGTLTFAPGVTTQTVSVSILDDDVFEVSETFLVALTAPVNATIADGSGTGTILDDGTGGGGTDNDTPTLAVTDINVLEGTDNFAVFTVSLSNPSTTPVSVSLALANGTATGGGTDFGPDLEVSTNGGTSWTPAASATFAPGSTSVLVRTPIINDLIPESLENFTLTVATTVGTTTNPSVIGTATIADNEGAPTLSINNVTVNEAAWNRDLHRDHEHGGGIRCGCELRDGERDGDEWRGFYRSIRVAPLRGWSHEPDDHGRHPRRPALRAERKLHGDIERGGRRDDRRWDRGGDDSG